ncbi:GlxA family transcriptional regulator [Sedimenticola sp.]|uniref:GlxA family transcriptional regulator n=1 Tax=Sedimenticola sp. TaxID=1940285 RepID=UPI003D133426
MTAPIKPDNPLRLGFLVVPNYSMIAFTSAIEPLRMANQLSQQKLYEWLTVTLDGEPVQASNGIMIQPDYAAADLPKLDMLFVCSGINVADNYSKPLASFLNKLSRQHVDLGALCTGTYLLAKSGLMENYRATIHWENLASTRDEFPRLQLTDELYEIDRDRYTCAGGTAPMDMMLQLINETCGSTLSSNISEQFMLSRVRDKHDRQRTPLHLKLGTSQPKLTEAVSLMEANVEEPITLDELSSLVGVSRRQLERLFQKYLNCVPTRYYMDLRLRQARLMLLQTDKPIVDVAMACGFVSAPHFSKCYRDYFGIPPREERRRHKVENPRP